MPTVLNLREVIKKKKNSEIPEIPNFNLHKNE